MDRSYAVQNSGDYGCIAGLGRAIAGKFMQRGLHTMLAARSEQDLRHVTQAFSKEYGDHISYAVNDLGSAESIRAMLTAARSRFGPIDVLVNNAGIGTYKPLVEWSEQEIMNTISVNLTGLILASRAVIPEMIEARRGLIINIGSL